MNKRTLRQLPADSLAFCHLSTGISCTTKAQYTEPANNYVADEDKTLGSFCQQKSNRFGLKNE
jgi:hypothetical protein